MATHNRHIGEAFRDLAAQVRKWGKHGEVPYSVEDGTAEPLPPDERISPDLETVGRLSAYFLQTDSSHYLKRHVETLQIRSASFGRRRLTIDVPLPVDEQLGKPRGRGDAVLEFWIPVTFLAKHPSRSNVDVRDDRGRVVPLLTREESNEISLTATLACAKTLLGNEPSPFLAALIAELVKPDGMRSHVALLVIREALRAEGAKLEDHDWRPFLDSLRRLSGNYAMWVKFRGRAGERRVVKLHYDVEFERQGILRQRKTTRRYLIVSRRSGVEHELDLEEPGDKNPYSPLRRVAARLASSTGLGAVNVGIESPYIVGSDSYHLQAESPPGVETRDIDLLARVPKEANRTKWSRDHGAHLYVSRTRLVQESAGLALLTLRIGRRGFMTLSWLSALLSALIIWLFYLTAVKRLESPEATATVLLFGPALLAALVVRPGEHPVATKLFSGVRLLVAFNGLLVIAAAAAVVHVRPAGWSIKEAWFLYAILASACAAVVSLGWVFSWDITYKLVKGLRRQLRTGRTYRRLSAWLLGLTLLVLLLGSLNSRLSIVAPEYLLAPLAALALACGFVAAGYVGLPPPSARLAAVVDAATGIAALAALAILVLHIAADWAWEAPWLRLAAVPTLGLTALWVNYRRWKHKRAAADTAISAGPAPISVAGADDEGLRGRLVDAAAPNWLQQTPSGDLVRRQAQKKATGIPDLIAPSAYREVGKPDEGISKEEATAILEALRDAPARIDAGAVGARRFPWQQDRSSTGDRRVGRPKLSSVEADTKSPASVMGRELIEVNL